MAKVLQPIYPGIIVAEFLSNTKRVVQANLLWNECLTILNKKALEKENDLDREVRMMLYNRLCHGFAAINEPSPAIESGKKLSVLLRKCKRKKEEGDTALMLASMHYQRSEYKKAQEYLQKALTIKTKIGDKHGEAPCYINLGIVFYSVGEYAKAEKYLQKAITIMTEIGDKHGEAACYLNLGNVFHSVGEYAKTEKYLQKALTIKTEIGDKHGEAACYLSLGNVFRSVGEYAKAEKYLQKALTIKTEIGDKHGEAACYLSLGNVFRSVGEYAKAEKYLQKALTIKTEIGDKHGEAACYLSLGNVFRSVGEYAKAEKYLQKALTIKTEIGDKHGEAACYGNLGKVFYCVGEYAKAEKYLQKALTIKTEIGDKHGEAACYIVLGNVFDSVGEYAKAEKYLQKALTITTEIGDKHGEAACYGNLGKEFHSVGEYAKAEKYLQKALTITTEIGDKHGEAQCYINLGNVFYCVGEYAKAEKYLQKALTITTEIGDKHGEAQCYINLGNVFYCVGEYAKAEKYLQKALTITTEIGDKHGEAACYGNLGKEFHSVGEYAKAEKYLQKALTIHTEIGDKHGEAACYLNLGEVFYSVREYAKAEKYFPKALTITAEIGDKHGEAASYGNLGNLFHLVGEYAKAEKYLQKALTIKTEIGDKQGEASCYGNLGKVFYSVGEYAKAEEYFKKAIQIGKDTGDIELQFQIHLHLSYCSLALTGNASEALSNLLASIDKCERLLNFLPNKDRYKISFFDEHASPYRQFSLLCCVFGKHYEALHVAEIGRARALADLVSDRYFLEKEVSLNPESFAGILKVIRDSSNRTCLYISYHGEDIFLWTAKQSKPIAFRSTNLCESYVSKHGEPSVDDLFKKGILLRNFHVLPQEQCEDRSLFSSYTNQLTTEANLEDSLSSLRPLLDEEEVYTDTELPTLFQVYNMLIAPVSDLLEGSEIIVVPDRCFFQVPFAALHDECNRYLSDTFRIRIVPSLTTLKLILDSPAGSHSETGALIVGEPRVTDVYFKGELRSLCPLPGAKAEAEMIARLLPESHLLIREQATKQAVLQRLPSVSLVHFAAHGDAERGEIALTPPDSTMGIPHEQDYLLSMAEISQVRLTAKLVVLSCCHTARGQIKTEGVVGIARAFLGSGARSVLVALWALQDDATEKFMRRFYENLVQGESASECLHRAMKWMRKHGFPEVRQWAPFMLIGDDVSFHFGEEK